MAKKRIIFRLKNVERVMQQINDRIKEIEGDVTTQGFIRFGIELRRSMENESPTVPRDTGNLRSSYFMAIKSSTGTHNEGTGFSAQTKIAAYHKQRQAAIVSGARTIVQSSNKPLMLFGFSANYSIPVHERTGGNINWSHPGSGALFFQKGLERMRDGRGIQILRDSAKLK